MYTHIITLLYKIFFIGLLIQFFLQTFVTFKLGLDQERMQYIWLWKEGIVGILGILALGNIIRNKKRKQIIASPTLGWRTLGLLATVGLTATIHLVLLQQPLSTYILAFKYDFFGFFILLVGLHSSGGLTTQIRQEIIERYGRVIKRALVGGVIWYMVIFIKPGTLKLFGYDNFMYEGGVDVQPPAAYYTLINHGITRNQFLFERPISRGFFLTAFFPLFFVLFLYKQPLTKTWSWRAIYLLNVISTFSRAAWGSWIIELLLLGIVMYRKNIKKFMLMIVLPVLLVILGIGGIAYKSVFQRSYSTNGHIEMFVNGAKLYAKSPLLGHGGGRAGPASHREGGPKFNPENQYLQILIEFGLLGFLPWFLLYLTLNFLGLTTIKELYKQKMTSTSIKCIALMLGAVSIGMVGLSASGMVLHSFSDRMIVYPLMLVFGIVWMQWIKKDEEITPK